MDLLSVLVFDLYSSIILTLDDKLVNLLLNVVSQQFFRVYVVICAFFKL